ncbi:small heat shock protein [Corynascus similis CBS 632.67]
MAFFPSSVYNSEASFTPLFRLLDEFDNYSREAYGTTNNERPRHRGRRQPASFQPKFDARETDVAFELYGEFPGLERDKINIEFTEPQTLVIRGRSERTYASPSAGSVDNGSQQQQATDAITEKGEENSGEVVKNNNKATTEKYWLQERTIGDFTRVFNFPVPVDQDAVSARLHNGILSVVVPKARKHEGRRIAIN